MDVVAVCLEPGGIIKQILLGVRAEDAHEIAVPSARRVQHKRR
jgi:hypothetical protein